MMGAVALLLVCVENSTDSKRVERFSHAIWHETNAYSSPWSQVDRYMQQVQLSLSFSPAGLPLNSQTGPCLSIRA